MSELEAVVALRKLEARFDEMNEAAMMVAFCWSGQVEYEQPLEMLLDQLVDAVDACTAEAEREELMEQ